MSTKKIPGTLTLTVPTTLAELKLCMVAIFQAYHKYHRPNTPDTYASNRFDTISKVDKDGEYFLGTAKTIGGVISFLALAKGGKWKAPTSRAPSRRGRNVPTTKPLDFEGEAKKIDEETPMEELPAIPPLPPMEVMPGEFNFERFGIHGKVNGDLFFPALKTPTDSERLSTLEEKIDKLLAGLAK